MNPPSLSRPVIEWGSALRPAPNETVCGDLPFMHAGPAGALVAVVDGLGHGVEAAKAARSAIEVLEGNSGDLLVSLVNRCHTALLTTRGAVMTLASFDPARGRVSCLGVGNVSAVLLRPGNGGDPVARHLQLLAGIVGYQLPALRATEFDIAPGDLLIVASDGVGGGFHERVVTSEGSQPMAENILRDHAKGSDDALVLVVRYLGTET